jgi:hypothetical protein
MIALSVQPSALSSQLLAISPRPSANTLGAETHRKAGRLLLWKTCQVPVENFIHNPFVFKEKQ